MKRLLTLLPVLLLMVTLTPTAQADVIFSPIAIAAVTLANILPWLLVAAVVILTLVLIVKLRRKK